MTQTAEMLGFGPRGENGNAVALAMQVLHLSGRVTIAGGRLIVRHVFQSAERVPLEVVYAFALPRDAALRSFFISGEQFEVHSELRPTQQAREEYEQALEAGHLASLAQAYGDGIVNLTVGNIRPGEVVRVYLEILSGVEAHDDGFRFRFPFTMAPCYQADARMSRSGHEGVIELPEERFSDLMLPPWNLNGADLHRIGFNIDVEHPGGISTLSSPSHAIAVSTVSDTHSSVGLATAGDIPDRDLVLDVLSRTRCAGVLAGVDAQGTGRAVVVAPSILFGDPSLKNRRLVFLIDRSGSMRGQAIAQARNAVSACLGALSADDQFNIVAFDTRLETFNPQICAATELKRNEAAQFLQRIDARGGTELAAGLQAAIRTLGKQGGDILLLTDGQVYGGEEILSTVRAIDVRVHCLGIGSASQDRFLALLARETDGVSRFLTPRERVDLAALELFNDIGHPVVDGLQISAIDADVAPPPPARLFAGAPLVAFLSQQSAKGSTLLLHWTSDDGNKQEKAIPVAFSRSEDGEMLRALHGARIITDLEAKLDCAERGTPRKRRMTRSMNLLEAVSMQYGLASQAVSLVAVVQREGDNANDLPTTLVVPLYLPQDQAPSAYFPNSMQMSVMEETPSPCFAALTQPSAFTRGQVNFTPKTHSKEQQCAIDSVFATAERNELQHSMVDRDDESDFLVKLAARLQPDGGLPGNTTAERLLGSALAALLFKHTVDMSGTAFVTHLKRLKSFIQNQQKHAPLDIEISVLTMLVQMVEHGGIPQPVLELARRMLTNKTLPDNAWNSVKQCLPEVSASSLEGQSC